MKLIDFNHRYPDELSCKIAFKQQRDETGVICKRCSCKDHYWINTREQYQCKKCKFRTTLRSGTLLENTKLSYYNWFLAMHLVTSTKKGFSAKELQRQLDYKFYEPIWRMMHKIRAIMGMRDEQYKLDGLVELDDAHFEIAFPIGQGTKRGLGSEAKATVIVSASYQQISNPKKHQKPTKLRYVKMKVVDDLKAKSVKAFITNGISPESTVVSDGSNSFNLIITQVRNHEAYVLEKDEVMKVLPWVHTAISNCKRTILSVYHCVKKEYLQKYLSEFCYRLNRRHFNDNIFERLLKISTLFKNEFLYV